MGGTKLAVVAAFLVVVLLPFAFRTGASSDQHTQSRRDDDGNDIPRLIIVTPHVEQIRNEFEAGFRRWIGRPVVIDWRTPGGTSEIVRLLRANYDAAINAGRITQDGNLAPGATPLGFDLMMGGGSYDHGRLKQLARGVQTIDGQRVEIELTMSIPAGLTQQELDEVFGENKIGAGPLYDPQQHWIGTALSSFGIVYNRQLVSEAGLPDPNAFNDLTDFRYFRRLAMTDPRNSGSVTTTYESILNNAEDWDAGWRILREMAANARYFSSSATRAPIDVSQGDALAGLAIDFYGRGQAQAVLAPNEHPSTGRVGYVDPAGAVFIDPDPVSLLRAGPNPQLAREFIRYCLTEEAQALWQFRAVGENRSPADLGPTRHELRRLPIRRSMYRDEFFAKFIDPVNPYDIASPVSSKGWRSAISPMIVAFGIDTANELQDAWSALQNARNNPNFPQDSLAEMERLFYEFPEHVFEDGSKLRFNEQNYRTIRAEWSDQDKLARARIAYQRFFRDNYRRVVDLARSSGRST